MSLLFSLNCIISGRLVVVIKKGFFMTSFLEHEFNYSENAILNQLRIRSRKQGQKWENRTKRSGQSPRRPRLLLRVLLLPLRKRKNPERSVVELCLKRLAINPILFLLEIIATFLHQEAPPSLRTVLLPTSEAFQKVSL